MDQFENQEQNNGNAENPNAYEQNSPVQFSAGPAGNSGYSLNLSFMDLKSLTGWATFKAILEIISGALACLGIITAAFGVPQIISGVKLLNAVDELKRYIAANDMQRISDSMRNMQQYFKLRGITSIVKIGFYILVMIIYAVVIGYFISHSGDFMHNWPDISSF